MTFRFPHNITGYTRSLSDVIATSKTSLTKANANHSYCLCESIVRGEYCTIQHRMSTRCARIVPIKNIVITPQPQIPPSPLPLTRFLDPKRYIISKPIASPSR
ncbi:hypothetical protein HJC23_014030 [Cyclotella cryptica]|uniref:Uncharacterized protein n=1 Tax=Cyclotella cryptica TaxID=29204 RepID=A0ABD3QTI6_9STRA